MSLIMQPVYCKQDRGRNRLEARAPAGDAPGQIVVSAWRAPLGGDVEAFFDIEHVVARGTASAPIGFAVADEIIDR